MGEQKLQQALVAGFEPGSSSLAELTDENFTTTSMISVLFSHTMFKRLTVVRFPEWLALCRQNNGFCRAELHVYKIENSFAWFWNFLKLWRITFVSHNKALQGSLFWIKLLVRFLNIWLITFVSVRKNTSSPAARKVKSILCIGKVIHDKILKRYIKTARTAHKPVSDFQVRSLAWLASRCKSG